MKLAAEADLKVKNILSLTKTRDKKPDNTYRKR